MSNKNTRYTTVDVANSNQVEVRIRADCATCFSPLQVQVRVYPGNMEILAIPCGKCLAQAKEEVSNK